MSTLNTVLLLIHLLIALAMVGVVLLQKSEGGALGIGGGGGGGFLTGRGKANLLTRVTAALAACFFATSLLLTVVGQRAGAPKESIIDKPSATAPATPATSTGTTAPATTPASGTATPPAPASEAPASGGILDKLR